MLYVADLYRNVYLGFKKVEICRGNFSLFNMRFIIPSFKTSIYTFSPLLCLIKYLMYNFFRCISAWQRSRDIVRAETVQTVKLIQVIYAITRLDFIILKLYPSFDMFKV